MLWLFYNRLSVKQNHPSRRWTARIFPRLEAPFDVAGVDLFAGQRIRDRLAYGSALHAVHHHRPVLRELLAPAFDFLGVAPGRTGDKMGFGLVVGLAAHIDQSDASGFQQQSEFVRADR